MSNNPSVIQFLISEEKGRHFVASQNIKKGTTIIRIRYSASALQEDCLTKHCSSCFIPLLLAKDKRRNSCEYCHKVSWCSTCGSKTNIQVHKESGECQFVKNKKDGNPSMFTRLVLRLLHFAKTNNEIKDPFRHLDNVHSHIPITDSWCDLLSLQPLDEDGIECSQIVHEVHSQLKNTKMALSDSEWETVTMLISRVIRNGHEINYPRTIGVGLYPTGAIFNHSCTPNIAFSQDQFGNLIFRSLQDIPQGTELCSSYIDVYQAKSQRQKELQSRYNFTCRCSRCETEIDESLIDGIRQQPMTSQKDKIEDMIRQLHTKAIQFRNMDDDKNLIKCITDAITAGEPLQTTHYLNLQTFQMAGTAFGDIQDFEKSMKYLKMQLTCLKLISSKLTNLSEIGGPFSPLIASKHRDLALSIQDQAQVFSFST